MASDTSSPDWDMMEDDFDEAAEYEMSDYDIRLRALRLALSVANPKPDAVAVVMNAELYYDFLTEGMEDV